MATDETLRDAMLAHRAGRLAAAAVGYRRVLRHRPDDPRALHFLALLTFHQGNVESAIRLISQSLEVDPINGRGWNALGSMFIAAQQPTEARSAYRRATEVAPEGAE